MSAGERSAADIAEQPSVLARVVESNADALQASGRTIEGARCVRLCGIGSSRNAAGYGATALHVLAGLPSVVLPAPGAVVPLPEPRKDEPLVVLSQSGRTPALIDVAERARTSGVPVIAVTNEPGSPLEALASVCLGCHAGPERVVPATKSLTAQCLLLRALAASPDAGAIAGLARAIDETIALDVAPAVRDEVPSAVVVAGFADDWIAREVALKFVEMCGRPVTSSSVIEHFHGPRAVGGRVVAFLDPNDPNSRELGSLDDVTTVGPHADFDMPTPSTGDASLDALVTIVAGQRIAHATALHIGEDPDAPRGLSKVTPTR